MLPMFEADLLITGSDVSKCTCSQSAGCLAARPHAPRPTLLRGYLNAPNCDIAWLKRQTIFFHALEVHLQSASHVRLGFFLSATRRHAAWHLGRVGGVVSTRPLNHNDEGPQWFSTSMPACFRMLFRVPAANSFPALPATVTRPGFTGCLNWRWLPDCATKNHPSSRSSLITSRTFMVRIP